MGRAKLLHGLARQTHRDLAVRVADRLDDDLAFLYGHWLQADWTPDQLRRARARIEVAGHLPPDAVRRALAKAVGDDCGEVTLLSGGRPAAVLRTTRSLGRRRRWSGRDPSPGAASALRSASVEVGPVAEGPSNLEDWFAATVEP